MIIAIGGDVENYSRAVAECDRRQSAGMPGADEGKWTVMMMVLFPEMVTKEKRPRLLELSGKMDAYWRPGLTAAIHFRMGDFKEAAELLDASGGFSFLAAMAHYRLGNQDRARQQLKEGNSWIRQQREKDPGAGAPRQYYWAEWAFMLALQYEATELIDGPAFGANKLPEHAVGEARFQAALARHLAARGNASAAKTAAAKACALFAEKLAKEPESTALAVDLFAAYQLAGRTREAIPYLAKAASGDPKATLLSLKVAALQAWFGQEKELAATRKRLLAFAKNVDEPDAAEQAAKACSILPATDKAELAAAVAIAHKGVELDKGGEWREWRLLALGMAEYRSGNDSAASEALLAAANARANNPIVTGISAFFRAMSLFRQGKKDEARKVAIAAASAMKPLPADEENPLLGDATHEDLILWLAYKEAKAMIHFDLVHGTGKPPRR